MSQISKAYNFAYSDCFSYVVAPLNPARVDTLEIVFLDETAVPEPGSAVLVAMAAGFLSATKRKRDSR